MKLEYVLTLVLVLVLLAVVVSVVAPSVQAELVQALAPVQDTLSTVPVQ